jgi:hypothetical protein
MVRIYQNFYVSEIGSIPLFSYTGHKIKHTLLGLSVEQRYCTCFIIRGHTR